MSTVPEVMLVGNCARDELVSMQGIMDSGALCHVTLERCGIDALNSLHASSQQLPALLILDYALTNSNALEILSRLRRNNTTCLLPVVVLGAAAIVGDLVECYNVGANSCIIKPDDDHELAATIGQIARYWLETNKRCSHPDFVQDGKWAHEYALTPA